MTRKINFSAGPATLPPSVLAKAAAELVDYQGCGMSVMEMSHRSAEYDAIHNATIASLTRLLGVPDSHAVLLLQGGASLQFIMAPMNLMRPARKADYVVTGAWSKKAVKEAKRCGEVRIAGSSEDDAFCRIPEVDADPGADYLHYTTNNTITGTQWSAPPATEAPLVADMSSDIMSKPIDVAAHGLIYAGAQKNLGPSGVTVAIVDRGLLERIPDDVPTMLDYRTHVEKNSMFNTPPCYGIYMLGLVCDWVEEQGGPAAMQSAGREKARLIYDVIDGGDFYRGTVEPASRSMVNIPFRLPSEELEKAFVAASVEAGMTNLKGHRSVGGIRASIYNAMPREGVEALAAFMRDFQAEHG